MRILKYVVIVAVVLAPAVATAQTAEPVTSTLLDFGVRGTSTTGQPARYERFRDMSDGLFLETFRFKTERNGWFINLGADHAGRKDQRYVGSFVRPGQFKSTLSWDQIPFLMSQSTRTPYQESSPGVFTLSDATQLELQGLSSTLRYAAFQDLVAASPAFDLKSRRHTAAGGFEYFLGKDASFIVNARHIKRDGALPYGAYLGTEIELPQPINQKMNDVDATLEAVRGPALFRLGYTGSWFTNDASPTIFDNPGQLLDTSSYGGRGRLPQLAPDSSRIGINGMVSFKMAHRSRLTASGMVATLKDGGQPVIPFTISTASSADLFRSTVEGKAKTTAANIVFTSRPTDVVNVTARYRHFNYDNQTPLWLNSEQVRYDRSYQSLSPAVPTEAFSARRNNFDADLHITPKGRASFTVGGSRNTETRNDRVFTGFNESVGRVKFDLGGSRVTIRSVYEYSQRRGEGLDEEVLIEVSEKPTMRHYDIADRNRSRGTIVASFMPDVNWGLNLSTSVGRDDYLNSAVGLRDNNHNVYSAGITGTPTEQFSLAMSYSYEDYHTRQMNNTSRGDIDLANNFSTAGDDKVHSFIASADVINVGEKLDLHFTFDTNRTRATYTFGIGDPVASSLSTPSQLPTITSDLTRGTADAVYHITQRVAVGVTYWYDKYSLNDFTLDAQAREARVPGNYMLLGYAFEPYTAHTAWGRLIVKW